MNYCLFIEHKFFHLIQNILNDYPIPDMICVAIDEADDVLPPHMLITTEIYDANVYSKVNLFFKNIGYTGKFKLLKPMTRMQAIDDFELVPP